MSMNNRFTFIGGDDRQIFMAKQLYMQNYPLAAYGLDIPADMKNVMIASSLKEAMELYENIICPIPFTRDHHMIFSKSCKDDLTIDNFESCLVSEHRIFGGNISPRITEHCKSNHIDFLDFMDIEEITIKNAVATAEGAIAEAIKASPKNLHQSFCLVMGYGRCAKILAHKLKGLDVNVTVSARNTDQLAMADSFGCHTISHNELFKMLPKFDFIFNTIPAMVLDEESLMIIKRNATIIDLASNPGGTDFEKSKELGINALLCLGLPGKYAPQSSAEILNSIILKTCKGISP